MPPREVVRKALRRARGERGYDLAELLSSSKHMRPQKFQDFFNRYQMILARTCNWAPIDFSEKLVLEIGCGPLLGFGPLAVFLGARAVTAIEPEFQPQVARRKEVEERYFLNVYKDLSGLFGQRMPLAEFLDRIWSRIRVVANPIAGVRVDAPHHVVLSNSCLEHLDPLRDSVQQLRALCAPDARQMHLVDFGNHRPTRNPFAGIYSTEPEQYFRTHGRGINLARAPDMLREFRAAGFKVEIAPYYFFREFYAEPFLPYWRDRYPDEDLFLKSGLLYTSE